MLLAAGALVLAGCGDDQATDNITPPPGAQAQFRVANFISDPRATAVNIIIEGVPYAANVAYGGAGAQRLILTGQRAFRVVATADESIELFNGAVDLPEGNGSLTIVFAGMGESVTPMVLDDSESEPDDTQYRVRVVHAATQAGAVDVYVVDAGAGIGGATPVQAGATFGASFSVLRPVGTASDLVITEAGTTTPIATTTIAAPSAPQARTYVLGEASGGGAPYTITSLAF